MSLQPGERFDHFEIRAPLAQGGMAELYHARDVDSGREVVLKIPSASLIGDPAQYERFQRELAATSLLDHPAIQHGLGSGRFNRVPYLVTEFVAGVSLRRLIDEQAPFPPGRAVGLIRKIAEAMAYCHDHAVVHRDLKPENIIITPAGQPVIVDFGLALTKGARRVTYANLTAAAGTLDYMAPEQVEGQRGDKRTDVYAVGVMLFELLTGNVPFTGDSPAAIIAQKLRRAAPRLDRLNRDVAPQLAAVAARCLQRDPAARYPDMHALLRDLDHPEGMNTSILEQADTVEVVAWWRSEYVRGVAIAIVVMALIVVLALVGQSLAR